MGDPNALWTGALAALGEVLPKPQLDAWVGPLRPLRFDGEILTLGVNNDLHKAYLAKNCLPQIEDALSLAGGRPIAVRFELDVRGQGLLFGHDVPARRRPAQVAGSPDEGGLPLNPRYVFESFVVGNNNRFAHAAATGVAEKLGRTHNPLFLYGGVGLGKTHLLHAIGNFTKAHYPRKRVLYTTSEKFTNDMIKAIRSQNNSEFRRKYRKVDLLLMDDIQFLQGKESTQDEFFHTFNDLLAVQHQVVATSDTHPKDIKVEDRLRSRFQGGLVADLLAPDLETRIAILKSKAESESLIVPEEVLSIIAEAVPSNIRELGGALNRVVAFTSLSEQPISASSAREALRDLISVNRPPQSFERIQLIVARYFSLEPGLLVERTRTDAVAYPRQIAMYLCRELLGSSYIVIGNRFGGRDHSTAIHAIEKIRRLKDSDPKTTKHIDDIRRSLDE